MREHRAKEPQIRGHSVDSESTLAKFAKRPIGVELSIDYSSDEEGNKKPSGKGSERSSGKDSVSKKGIITPFDYYGIDTAPMQLFENQIVPVLIHNISNFKL